MSKPVAYFGYSKIGLTVNFTNTSLNNPSTYEWDFGDGNKSIEKNPSHTYSEVGFFTVNLFVSNSDGESSISITIGASDIDDMLNASILELVDHYIPTALIVEMSGTEKISLIQKWQLYLQPLVVIPYEVLPEDTHNEFKWPGLTNALIAQLVALDITIQAANQFVASSMSTGGGSTSSQTSTGKQQIKSIETGPAKTEWYEDKTAENVKSMADAVSSATRAGGGIDLMKESICMLAKRLSIYLPMCGELDITVMPRVFKACNRSKHNANPFGVTRRMR